MSPDRSPVDAIPLFEALGPAGRTHALLICSLDRFVGQIARARLITPTLDILGTPDVVAELGVQRIAAPQLASMTALAKAAVTACLRPPDNLNGYGRDTRERYLPAVQALAAADAPWPTFSSDPREASTQLSVAWAVTLGITDPLFVEVTWDARDAIEPAAEGLLPGFVIALGRTPLEGILADGLEYAARLSERNLKIVADHGR